MAYLIITTSSSRSDSKWGDDDSERRILRTIVKRKESAYIYCWTSIVTTYYCYWLFDSRKQTLLFPISQSKCLKGKEIVFFVTRSESILLTYHIGVIIRY